MRTILTACLASMLLASAASAGTWVFETPIGQLVGGQPVNARVTITTGAGTIHVELENLIVDPRSVIQNVSALGIALNGGQSDGTLTSSSANLRSVANDTYTDFGAASTGWLLENDYDLGAIGLRLCDLCAGAAGPEHTLIGQPNSSNLYANANDSIDGNAPHNPFLSGVAVFDLDVPGVTSSTTVTRVRFQFGTEDNANTVDVTPVVAVESSSWEQVKQLYRETR